MRATFKRVVADQFELDFQLGFGFSCVRPVYLRGVDILDYHFAAFILQGRPLEVTVYEDDAGADIEFLNNEGHWQNLAEYLVEWKVATQW